MQPYIATFPCACCEEHEIVIEQHSSQPTILHITDLSRFYAHFLERLRVVWHILRYGQCQYSEFYLEQPVAIQLGITLLTANGFTVQEGDASIPRGEMVAMAGARRCD